MGLLYCCSMDNDTPRRSSGQPARLQTGSNASRRRLAVLVAAIVVVVVLALVIFLRYYVDWLWFGEVALRTVFWRRITTGLVVGVIAAVVFFAIVYGNVEIARRLAPKYRPVEGVDVVEPVNERAVRRVRQVGLALSLVVAVIVGFSSAGSWLTFAQALNAVPFGVDGPHLQS